MLDSLAREDKDKTSRLRKRMESEGLEAAIFRLPENVVYVSGYWPFYGLCYVFFPLDGEPSIITIADEEPHVKKGWIKDLHLLGVESVDKFADSVNDAFKVIGRLAEEKNLTHKAIGYEGSMELFSTNYQRRELWSVGVPFYEGLRRTLPEAQIRDIAGLLYDLRSIKTPNELSVLKIVNKIADMGLEAFHNAIQEGRREIDVQAIVEHEVVSKGVGYAGVERVLAIAFVMSGKNSAEAYKMYNMSTEKKLKRGDLVLIELNVNAEGYWSDTTRTYVLGVPSEEQKRLLDAVIEAQRVAVEKIKDGVSAAEVNDTAVEVVRRHGLEKYLKHRLGHGIGCSMHEPIPALHHASTHILRANMVHSVEPGLYDPDLGGVRMEDMVLDTEHGAERLNKYYIGG